MKGKPAVLKRAVYTVAAAVLYSPAIATQVNPPPYEASDSLQVQRFLNNSEYQYHKPRQADLTLLDQFAQWIGDILRTLFGSQTSADVLNVLFYTIGIGLIVFAVFKILDIQVNTLFSKSSPPARRKTAMIADTRIPPADLLKMIEEARKNGKRRKVIELQYILALKRLSEASLVEVKESKTNQDYLYEMADQEVKPWFRELSKIFEYTWYGNFEVTPGLLEKSDSLAGKIEALLKAGR